jgi:hypothetical protein
VPGGGVIHGIVNRPVAIASADHQDSTWFLTGTDRDVLGAGRAVEVVPLPQASLLSLHHRDALPTEHEETFLLRLRVIEAGGLPQAEHVDADSQLR